MQNIWLIRGTNSELARWFKEHHDYISEFDSSGIYITLLDKKKERRHFICVIEKVWGDKKRKTSRLSHECLHAAFTILVYAGVKLSFDSEEALAYYHQYLFHEALKLTGYIR